MAVRAENRTVQLDDHAFLHKNGTAVPVALSASPLLFGASAEGAVVVFRDITKERSEKLRVKRELAALTWVGRIREALDDGGFVLYSQPIVPLRGGRPSEELLLRMVGRRADELVRPDSFLGVAEKYGLITEIDRWVVTQAAALAATGRHVGANLSAESIVSVDMVGVVAAALAESGAHPSNLVFEITETSLMRDIEKGHAFARGLLDLGCKISLDDFGTGYGTFTHVKKLAISYLKIDIQFVRGLVGSSANQHVVKAIVNLAQGFGCETVAEGVEDAESLELLAEYGVDFAQGYYLGRPAPLRSATV
jgi:EAL domain-containing protein (putative c-di-GMP-specific phosphodiesterase class I)